MTLLCCFVFNVPLLKLTAGAMRYKYFIPLTLILSLASDQAATHVGQTCTMTYQTHGGLDCRYCPAGTYLTTDCKVPWGNPDCPPCPEHQYQPSCHVARSCGPCNSCERHGAIVQMPCTATQDTKCVCPNGRYYQRHSSEEGLCIKHTTCPVGSGVITKGTPWNDTVCGVCRNGTYSDTDSYESCKPCTACGGYHSRCTNKFDAACSNVTGTTGKGGLSLEATLGLSIGLPLPALVAIVVALLVLRRKRRCCFSNIKSNKKEMDDVSSKDQSERNGVEPHVAKPPPNVALNGDVERGKTSHCHNGRGVYHRNSTYFYNSEKRVPSVSLSGDTDLSDDAVAVDARSSLQNRQTSNNHVSTTKKKTCYSTKGPPTNGQITQHLATTVSYIDVRRLLRNCPGVDLSKVDVWISDIKRECTAEGSDEEKYQLLTKYYTVCPHDFYNNLCQSMATCAFNTVLEDFKAWYSVERSDIDNRPVPHVNNAIHTQDTKANFKEINIDEVRRSGVRYVSETETLSANSCSQAAHGVDNTASMLEFKKERDFNEAEETDVDETLLKPVTSKQQETLV